MTIKNAIAKLEKAGFKVEYRGHAYYAEKANCRYYIDFLPNGQDLPENSMTCLRVVHYNDKDDMQSDYCAGSFMDSMKQAIRAAETWGQSH